MANLKKILVIDDEEILTKTFAKLLERFGFEAYVAKNSQDAEAMIEEENFDLLISDIRMPGQDGVRTTQKLFEACRRQHRAPIPVIFITGYADTELERMAMSLQPVAYLHKPFDVDKLIELIQKKLGTA